jgi:hypothetical protein
VVALVVLRDPQWMALHDLAQVEMRVRDVSGGHPPQLGLGGRFEGLGATGSHPGPISFYLLWPVYTLLGSTGWALQASAGFLSAVAAGLAVWVAHRRGGMGLALAVAAVFAVLARGYGAEVLTSAWNPHVPVAWWWLFLLAVWSLLVGDVAMAPVAMLAALVCVETHIPYVVPVGWLAVLVAIVLIVRLWRGDIDGLRRAGAEGIDGAGATDRGRLLRWVGAGVAVGLVGIAPPVVEQITHSPGNVSILVENFQHPYDDRVAVGEAVDTWLEHLDVFALLRQDTNDVESAFDHSLHLGRRWPGLALLAAWAAAAVVAWRRRGERTDLVALHAVAGVAVLATLFATSRIFGPVWPYLVFSAWGTTALVVLATAWTLAPPASRPVPVVAAVAAVALAAFAVDSAFTSPEDAALARGMVELSGATGDALADDPAGCGDDCRYSLQFTDPVHIVSPVFGLLLDLEKQGYDVRAEPGRESSVRPHRIADPATTDGVLHLVVTDDSIDELAGLPGFRRLAEVDPPGDEPPVAVFLAPVPAAAAAPGDGDAAVSPPGERSAGG